MFFNQFNIATTLYYPSDGRTLFSFCLDSEAGISLIGRSCFKTYFSTVKTYLTPIPVPVAGVTGVTQTSKYTVLNIRMKTQKGEFIRITGEIHIVPRLSCSIIVANNILQLYRSIIDVGAEKVTFAKGAHTVSISVFRNAADLPRIPPFPVKKVARMAPKERKVAVYAAEATTLESGQGVNIKIHHRPLAAGKSYLFTPYPIKDLATAQLATASKAIVTDDPGVIPFANFGEAAIRLHPQRQIGCLEVLKETHMGARVIEDTFMSRVFIGNTDLGNNQPFVIAKDPDKEFNAVHADISDHWGKEYADQLRKVVERHAYLFRPSLGSFNDGIEMPIRFKDESDVAGLKINPYNLSRRDRIEADKILDPLVEDECVEKVPLGQLSAAALPAFVVWNKGKPQVVVDLRKINAKLYPDAYPLPRQNKVLGALGRSCIFTSLDMQKSFFQQRIKPEDRWKTAFATVHRGHEQMTVSLIGLSITPGFFQH